MNKLVLMLIFCLSALGATNNEPDVTSANIWESKNIWIKTYSNNRNYNIIINNIVKIEQKIKRAKKNQLPLDELNSRLEIQKAKLGLYERNKNFSTLLLPFKYEIPEITIQDYIFKDSMDKLNNKIDEYIFFKNQFYMANSLIKNLYKNKKQSISKFDVKYFEEHIENIEKTHQNLLEARDELTSQYEQYNQDKLQKHIVTIIVVAVAYFIYKIFSFILLYIENKIHKDANRKNYKKILSILFFILLFVFLVVRYLNDFVYIITFLSVVAAALTIALREIILNIVGSIYIFFSNMVRVGDRIMIQFETKHTIGDVADMSLMKIKLNEIEDYTNVKEVKHVGRTIYIPNSYVFTKVFYNYSRKKNGLINDLIEFEFMPNSDFYEVEKITKSIFEEFGFKYTINFTLNNLKTGVIGLISYQVHYKKASTIKGDISIRLLQLYSENTNIKLKNSKTTPKKSTDEE